MVPSTLMSWSKQCFAQLKWPLLFALAIESDMSNTIEGDQRCVSNHILQSSNPNSSTIWFDGEKIAITRGSILYLPLPFTDCIKYASNLLQMNNFYPQQLLSSEIDSFFLAFFLLSPDLTIHLKSVSIISLGAQYQMVSIQIWCTQFEIVIAPHFYWNWDWDFQIVNDLMHNSGWV